MSRTPARMSDPDHANLAMKTLIHVALLCTSLGVATNAMADKRANAPTVDHDAMVAYDSAEFTMGVGDREIGRYGDRWFVDQQPAHPVELDAFELDAREVTVEDFALFLTYAAGEYHFHPDLPIERVAEGYLPVEGTADEPIRSVDWEAADHYCKWAGKRLPTEAEWEYAATGTENREYPWGDEGPNCQTAVYFTGSTFCEDGPQPVDAREMGATPEGVMNLGGNVAEWVADYYDAYPEDGAARTNPTGPADGTLRAVRGGGHIEGSRWLRSKARWGAAPNRHSSNIGFRCAWSEDASDGAVRGELVLPADDDREDSPAPYVDAARAPLLLADDLLFPTDIVLTDDNNILVLDTGDNAIRRLSLEDYSLQPVAEDVGGARDLAMLDGVGYVTTDDGSLLMLDAATGMLDTVSDAEPEPTRLKTFAEGVFWFSDERLRRYDPSTDAVSTVVDGLVGPADFTVVDGAAYYTTDGAGQAADTFLATVAVDGGEPSMIIDESTFESSDTLGFFYLAHVHPLSGRNALRLHLRYRSFPNNSFVCDLDFDANSFTCPGYAPPTLDEPLASRGGSILVPIRNSLLRYDDTLQRPFAHLAPFTRPGGYVIGDDFVVWTDRQNGNVYMQQY